MADTTTSGENTGGALKNADILRYSEQIGGVFTPLSTKKHTLQTFKTFFQQGITAVNEWLTPETFEDGTNTLGTTESIQYMNTLTDPNTAVAYTTASMLAAYPLIPGSATAATWTYADVCVESMFRTMENASGAARCTFHDNRIYQYNQQHLLPFVSARVIKGQKWQFDGNSTLHKNISGVAKKLWRHMPADQTEAAGAYGSYAYIFNNLQFFGGNLAKGSGDVGIEIGAHYNSRVNDCYFFGWDRGIASYFGLSMEVTNCNFQANTTEGLMIATGAGATGEGVAWTGGTLTNSASNLVKVNGGQFAIANNSDAAFSAYGSDQPSIRDCVFESSGGAANHCILVDTQSSTLVNGMLVDNIHVETESLISHIRVRADAQGIQARINGIYPYVTDDGIPIVETFGDGIMIMQVGFVPSRSQTWKMAHQGSTNIYYNFQQVNLADFVNLDDPANWVTGGAYSIPPVGNLTFSL